MQRIRLTARHLVLTALACAALGAALCAPASAIQIPSGAPNESGVPEAKCTYMCSFNPQPVDNDYDDDGLSNYVERGTGYRAPASRQEWYQQCMKAGVYSESGCRGAADRYDPNNPGLYATSAGDPDTDSDGLLDGVEAVRRYEYERSGNKLRDRTNPAVWDTDGDGHSDGLEAKYTKTSPVKWDTDRDRLSDGAEGFKHRTNALMKDTDRDCVDDGQEVRDGTNPLVPQLNFCKQVLTTTQWSKYRKLAIKRVSPMLDPCRRLPVLCTRAKAPTTPTPPPAAPQQTMSAQTPPPAPAPAPQPAPAPAPQPAPERAASTLAVTYYTCDGTALWTPTGDPYTAKIRGRLLPAKAGSPVRVTHRRPRGVPPIVHTVRTDADGWWEDSVTAEEWSAGYGIRWEIQASFEGDAERLPSESATCTVMSRYP
jgi:hypothetical protein